MTLETVNIKINAQDDATSKIKKVGGSLGGLKTALKGVAVGFAAIKIKQFISESIELYKVQEKAEARLQASVSNLKDLGLTQQGVSQSVEFLVWDLKEYAKALQTTTTFGDEQIISAEAMLGTFQLTGNEIMDLTPALLDMAASMEKTSGQTADLNDLAIAMGKAMTTGAGALGRYGITLTDVQKDQFNLAEGVEKTALLVQILEDNFGGAAEELRNTTAGALQAAANDWGDFKETIGGLLAPLLARVAGWISEMATTLQWWMEDINVAWEEDWYGIRTIIEAAWVWIQENIYPLIESLWHFIVETVALIKKAWEGDWLAIKTILTTAWEVMGGIIEMALGIIRGIIEIATGLITGDWEMVWEGLKTVLISTWEGISDTMVSIISGIIKAIQSLIAWTRDAIAELVSLGFIDTPTFNPVARPTASIPAELSSYTPRANGGTVLGGNPYMVGERGAELFIPNVSGSIVPNNRLSGTVVNVTGTFLSEGVAEEVGDMIVRKLQLSAKVV